MKLSNIFLVLTVIFVSHITDAQVSVGNKIIQLEAHPKDDRLFIAKLYNSTTGNIEDIWEMTGFVESIDNENFKTLVEKKKVFPNGVHYSIYPNQTVRYEDNYVNGKKEGMAKAFYLSQKLKFIGLYKNGKLVNEATHYYENNVIKKKEILDHSSMDKVIETFFPNGNLKSKSEYRSYLLHGNSSFYFDNGETKRKVKFKHNEIVSEKCFDIQGNHVNCQPLITNLQFPGGIESFKLAIEELVLLNNFNEVDTSICSLVFHIDTLGQATLAKSYINNAETFDETIRTWSEQLPHFIPLKINNEAMHTLLELSFPFVKNKALWLGTVNQLNIADFTFNYDVLEDCSKAQWYFPTPKSNKVYMIVGKMPEFPGGEEALRSFIARNLIYPEEARKKCLQGKVFVTFIINQFGNIESPKIYKGVSPSLNNEALRVIKQMPRWTPGYHKGKKVSVSYTCPIKFSLR